MASLPKPLLAAAVVWRPLRGADVPYVAALEAQIHAAPWTTGNFRDALAAGYSALRRRARGPRRRVRRADARAGRGAVAQPLRRAGCAPRGPGPHAARPLPARSGAAGRRARVPRGARGQRCPRSRCTSTRASRVSRGVPRITRRMRPGSREDALVMRRDVGVPEIRRRLMATRAEMLEELGRRAAVAAARDARRARRAPPRSVRMIARAAAEPVAAAANVQAPGAAAAAEPVAADARSARIARLDWDAFAADVDALHRLRAVPDAAQVGARRGRPRGGVAVRRRGARAPTRTRAANRSWDRRAACSTTCWRRSA